MNSFVTALKKSAWPAAVSVTRQPAQLALLGAVRPARVAVGRAGRPVVLGGVVDARAVEQRGAGERVAERADGVLLPRAGRAPRAVLALLHQHRAGDALEQLVVELVLVVVVERVRRRGHVREDPVGEPAAASAEAP